MNANIQTSYQANANFEISVAINGQTYCVIYGEHINGYFCCVPDRGWGCEMAEPNDIFYNANSLQSCGAEKEVACCIATAIKEHGITLRRSGGMAH